MVIILLSVFSGLIDEGSMVNDIYIIYFFIKVDGISVICFSLDKVDID